MPLRDPLAAVLNTPPEDRGAGLAETVRRPGIVWCYALLADGTHAIGDALPPADAAFRWIHLNLSDQRSVRWLEGASCLPAALVATMLVRDGQPRFAAERGGIALVVHDRERDLDPEAIGRVETLHAALAGDLLVTGRYRPLRSGDLLRARLEAGAAAIDGPSALAILLGTLVDTLATQTLDLSTQLLEAEERLAEDDRAPDMRGLIGARRRSAQIHRLTGSLRAALYRMDREAGLPAPLAEIAHALLPRLATLDADVLAAQQQLRLLRDELDLQAAQRTNQNVYLLSVLTALMLPATLVTGFFGMNTGGLPFAQGQHGTLLATGVALGSGAMSYAILRMMGLVGRHRG